MLAVTLAGVGSIAVLLCLLVVLACGFSYWVSSGTFIGWWIATDIAHCIGQVIELIVSICSSWRE